MNFDTIYVIPSYSLTYEEGFAIGRIMFKCGIYDRCCIGMQFASYIFKYLVSGELEPTMDDLNEVDPALAKGMKEAVAINCDGFTENDMKEQLREKLVNGPLAALKGIYHGFHHEVSFTPLLLHKVDHMELKHIVCGEESITSSRVIDMMNKIDSLPSITFELLKQALKTFDSIELKQFLKFVTGLASVTMKSSIIVNLAYEEITNELHFSLPVAHVCSFCLDLAPFTNFEILRQKLKEAIYQTSFLIC